MITLYKNQHFCYLEIYQDLLGTWQIKRRSGKIGKNGIWTQIYKFENEQLAFEKLFDLEYSKRKLGFIYRD